MTLLLTWWFAITISNAPGTLVNGHSQEYATQAECEEKYAAAVMLFSGILDPATIQYGAMACEEKV